MSEHNFDPAQMTTGLLAQHQEHLQNASKQSEEFITTMKHHVEWKHKMIGNAVSWAIFWSAMFAIPVLIKVWAWAV